MLTILGIILFFSLTGLAQVSICEKLWNERRLSDTRPLNPSEVIHSSTQHRPGKSRRTCFPLIGVGKKRR